MLRVYLILLFTATEWLWAQPDTDIYLLQAQPTDSAWHFTAPRNITPRRGYDNQPSFTADSRYILFVSVDDRAQTDVYRYALSTGSSERMTDTPRRSEYSPAETPDGKGFTAVVVEEDSAQRLWYFPWGDKKGKVLMDEITGVGYYAWYDKKRLAMFLLGEEFTLQRAHRRWQKLRLIDDQIGRAIQRIPGPERAISYVDKGETPWRIMRWDAKTRAVHSIAPCLPHSEDYTWTPDGDLLMGQGGTLYLFRPGTSQAWEKIGDLGVGPFYRLAMSPDGRWLAVVAYQGEKP
jgi:hypothetical protein